MQPTTQQQPGDGITVRGSFNLFYLAVSGLATTLTPFLRTNFGSEALGFNGFAALVIILVYFTAYPSVGVAHFFWYWLLALLLQRCRTFWLHFRGRYLHSQYVGDPWLAVFFPSVNARHVRWLEPAACLLFALHLSQTEPWLGQLLAWASGGLFLRQVIDQHIDNKRVQRMRDAEIDQRYIVERLLRQRGR